MRLYHLTGKQQYFDIARKTLEFFADKYQHYGIMGTEYGLAVQFYLHPMQIHIVGSRSDEMTRRFLLESLKAYNPLKIVEVIDPTADPERLKNLGYPVTDVPTAYICFEGTCNSVENPEKIDKTIRG